MEDTLVRILGVVGALFIVRWMTRRFPRYAAWMKEQERQNEASWHGGWLWPGLCIGAVGMLWLLLG